ncbi:MAG TPA: branched-chain amino acid ABC transporter ATP-binding protein/permease [Alphaproteobacteria bacterium]|nr:branched-chain amino acid ABC transporter ATP-binding protein/permease [Alphaproteobacteria bacterium]
MASTLISGIRLPLAALAVILLLYPILQGDAYTLRLLTISGVYAILAVGYQFAFGYAGALSLAHGCFFGLGAYVTAILGATFGFGFGTTFSLSIALPGFVALAVALPVLRLETHYFALATLGIGQVVLVFALNWTSVTGGANGIAGVPPIAVLGREIEQGWPLLIFVWSIVAVGGALGWQVMRGLYGRAFQLMRENSLAALALGIDIGNLRLAAFLLSALYAGAAGALYAHAVGVVSPEALGFPIMVMCLMMVVIGGRARISGAVVGAVLLTHLPEWFRALERSYLIAYGAVTLVAIIAAPYGIVGAIERIRARFWPECPPPVPDPLRAWAPDETGPAGTPLLEVDDLTIAFGGVRALDGVHLKIARGEVIGLIGPNGSGKTTLVNLLTGLYRPMRGRIRFAGCDLARLPSFRIARLGIARTFQASNLDDDMTVLDNVAVARFVLERASFTKALGTGRTDARLARARGHAMALLDSLGLREHAWYRAGDLPQALRSRMEIARALALEPHLLILDEPAAGLSGSDQADLAHRLAALAAGGLTLLVIEHNMSFLMPLATRVICLASGRVIAQGAPAVVRNDARVIEVYLGAPAVPAFG